MQFSRGILILSILFMSSWSFHTEASIDRAVNVKGTLISYSKEFLTIKSGDKKIKVRKPKEFRLEGLIVGKAIVNVKTDLVDLYRNNKRK